MAAQRRAREGRTEGARLTRDRPGVFTPHAGRFGAKLHGRGAPVAEPGAPHPQEPAMSIFGNILAKIFPATHPAVAGASQAPTAASAPGAASPAAPSQAPS